MRSLTCPSFTNASTRQITAIIHSSPPAGMLHTSNKTVCTMATFCRTNQAVSTGTKVRSSASMLPQDPECGTCTRDYYLAARSSVRFLSFVATKEKCSQGFCSRKFRQHQQVILLLHQIRNSAQRHPGLSVPEPRHAFNTIINATELFVQAEVSLAWASWFTRLEAE